MGMYQVKTSASGLWHRRVAGNGKTACGLALTGAYLSREYMLDDQLCPQCFTPHERDTGEMKRLEREAIEHAEEANLVDAKWGGDEIDDEITDRHDEPLAPARDEREE